MATAKPDLTRIWANGAPGGNVVDPDVTTPGKFDAGWLAEVPPFEHFNFLQKLFTQGLAHNNEQGINVWDTDTTYPINALVKGSDGIIYKARAEQSGNDPISDTGVNWYDLLRTGNVFDVRAYGASSSATGAVNLAAFNAAITAANPGDTILIPADVSEYVIDISGGRTGAVLVNKRLNIRIEGKVKSGAGAVIGANPATIFNVSADDCTMLGGGSIIGDGTTNSVNTGTAATMPSLMYVSANNFNMTDIEIDTPFKIGVHLDSCFRANLWGNRFTGGPTTYTDTAYFAVRSDGGGNHAIPNNQFYPDGSGGMYVNCLFLVSDNCLVEGNIVDKPYEKLAYITGNGNTVSANVVIGNPGTIPGTNQEGTVGVGIRCDGSNNKITDNFTEFGGGAATRSGGGNDISGNTFLKAGSSGLAFFSATSSFDNNTARKNTMTNGNLAGVVIQSGILVAAGNFSNKRIDISQNIIEGFGITDPITNLATWVTSTSYTEGNLVKPPTPNGRYYVAATSGTSGGTPPSHLSGTVSDGGVDWTAVAFGTTNASIQFDSTGGSTYEDCIISFNNCTGGFRGIATNDMNDSNFVDNIVSATDTAFREDSGANNQYRFNRVSAPTEYDGLAVTSTIVVYEESDWIPVISDGTNDATMAATSANNGKLVRDGRRVTITANVVSTALASVSGAIRIKGLPASFPAGAGAKNNAGMAVGFAGGLAITAGHSVTGLIQPGNDFIDLFVWDATTGTTAMQHTEWTDDGNIAFSLTYFI